LSAKYHVGRMWGAGHVRCQPCTDVARRSRRCWLPKGTTHAWARRQPQLRPPSGAPPEPRAAPGLSGGGTAGSMHSWLLLISTLPTALDMDCSPPTAWASTASKQSDHAQTLQRAPQGGAPQRQLAHVEASTHLLPEGGGLEAGVVRLHPHIRLHQPRSGEVQPAKSPQHCTQQAVSLMHRTTSTAHPHCSLCICMHACLLCFCSRSSPSCLNPTCWRPQQMPAASW
jgi:hypothetical protein